MFKCSCTTCVERINGPFLFELKGHAVRVQSLDFAIAEGLLSWHESGTY